MKQLGNGGEITFDTVAVAQVTSWSIEESPSTSDEEDSGDTSGTISILFYKGIDEHILSVGTRIEITLKVSDGDSTTLAITKATITGRTFGSGVNSTVSGQLNFESRYPVTYP